MILFKHLVQYGKKKNGKFLVSNDDYSYFRLSNIYVSSMMPLHITSENWKYKYFPLWQPHNLYWNSVFCDQLDAILVLSCIMYHVRGPFRSHIFNLNSNSGPNALDFVQDLLRNTYFLDAFDYFRPFMWRHGIHSMHYGTLPVITE